MFLDMGYCHGSQTQVRTFSSISLDESISPQVLSLPQARPGQHPVNTDLVTSVARDCILACVECGLLAEVHNALSVQFPTSVEEVVEFRRDHIGSAEVCVRELLNRKNQLKYQQFRSPQYGLQSIIQPFCPEECKINFERTEDVTSDSFDDVEDEEPIFLSSPGDQLPVDIDDELNEDEFNDLKNDNLISRLENDLSKKNDIITKILEEIKSLKRDLTDFINENCSMESSLREQLAEKDNDLWNKDAIIEFYEKMIKDNEDEIYSLKKKKKKEKKK